MPEQGDIWSSPTLQSTELQESTRKNGVDFERHSVDISSNGSVSTMSDQSVSSKSLSLQRFDSRLSESIESLPVKLPSQADDNNIWLKEFERSQSMGNINIKFENFVNDACAVSSRSSCDTLTSPFADNTDKLNISNNFIQVREVSNTEIEKSEVKKEVKQDGRLGRFFKRIFCCSDKSKR